MSAPAGNTVAQVLVDRGEQMATFDALPASLRAAIRDAYGDWDAEGVSRMLAAAPSVSCAVRTFSRVDGTLRRVDVWSKYGAEHPAAEGQTPSADTLTSYGLPVPPHFVAETKRRQRHYREARRRAQ